MDGDNVGFAEKVIAMNRPKTGSLLDQILSPPSKPAAASVPVAPVPPEPPAELPPPPEPVKKADPRPKPGDAYRPHAQFMNRLEERQETIYFVNKDCLAKGFTYSYRERIEEVASKQPGGGIDLLMRFGGTEAMDVRIAGRNLAAVLDYIGRSTLPWVWERPPGRYPEHDALTVITSITFEPVER